MESVLYNLCALHITKDVIDLVKMNSRSGRMTQRKYLVWWSKHVCTVRGIRKLSSTGAGTDTDTGTDTGAIDNT